MNQTDCHVTAFRNTCTNEKSAIIQLSFMRHHCVEAFRYLCQTDTRCAAIAVRRKWAMMPDADSKLGWGDREAVANTLRKARVEPPNKAAISAIGAALKRYAPEHLDLVGGL